MKTGFPTESLEQAKNGGGGSRTRDTFPPESPRYAERWNSLAELEQRTALEQALTVRDGRSCFYCGSGIALTVDHVRARCHGGSDGLENLVWACRVCNWAKLARPAWLYAMWVVVRGPSRIRRRDLYAHRTPEGGASFTDAGWKPISGEDLVDDLLGALLRGERVDA